jgi:hypothetical protein
MGIGDQIARVRNGQVATKDDNAEHMCPVNASRR